MRRWLIIPLALAVAATILLVGRLGNDDDASGGGDQTQTVVTPVEIRTAVFEHAFSECASGNVRDLAAKYRTALTPDDVAKSAGDAWARAFKGGPDAAEVGRRACLQGFEEG